MELSYNKFAYIGHISYIDKRLRDIIIGSVMEIEEKTFGRSKRMIGWEEVMSLKTGEVSTSVKFKIFDQDFNFEKIWIKNLLFAIGLVGDKSIGVLMYFLENRNYENKVLANKEMIVRHTKISRKTVYRVVKKLIGGDIIRPLELGFQVNPNVIFNSLDAKRKNITRLDMLISYYKYTPKPKKEFEFKEIV